MDMNAAWLTFPLTLTGSREFDCGEKTAEQCAYYKQHWHFWYIADYVFALPTVAFFMSVIGIFIIGHALSSVVFRHRKSQDSLVWQKLVAVIRYLSYRGFHVRKLRWNSAPLGVLLLGLAGTVFFFCMDVAPQPYYWPDELYGGSPPLATRSGWMALACMPFVFATASKTNWITLLTGVAHERLQVFHRWISYAFFVLALMHTFPFIVYHIHWHDMRSHFAESLLFYWTGIVAIIFQAWLTFMSHSTIRKFGYEFFKATHFFAAVVFMLTFFWHCDYTLTSWHYFIATAAVYVPCFVYPWLRTCFEYGIKSKAQIFVEDNGFTRVVIPTTANWKPGQHCFVRFTSFGLLHAFSSHPFTICSSPAGPYEQSEFVFYIRHQRGFTAKLYKHALEHPGVSVPVLVDGPYGGINESRLYDADQLLVVAGGSGAGWCLPFIESFLRCGSSPIEDDVERAGAAKESHAISRRGLSSLRIVFASRDIDTRTWFLRTVNTLLSKYPTASASSSNIRVQVYLTGPAAETVHPPPPAVITSHKASSHSSSSSSNKIPTTIKGAEVSGTEFQGRPDLAALIREEAGMEGGALSVYVCGPTTMQNDVRNAVAKENLGVLRGAKGVGVKGVYLHTEHFEWA